MDEGQPIFLQIMEIVENDILIGVYRADDLIISTTQIAKLYSVNPTTAVKAIGKLADAGILYKKRGIGMCVAPGAQQAIRARRRERFVNQTLRAVLDEAATLGIGTDELVDLLRAPRKDGDR